MRRKKKIVRRRFFFLKIIRRCLSSAEYLYELSAAKLKIPSVTGSERMVSFIFDFGGLFYILFWEVYFIFYRQTSRTGKSWIEFDRFRCD